MREILFRGKREINNEWAFGHYIVLDPIDKPEKIRKPLHLIVPVESKFNSWNGYLFTRYPVVPETLGQFTGLIDKNGEKIFEGDILERRWPVGHVERVEIRFESSSFGYHIIGTADCCDPIDDCEYGIDTTNFEIIGNIHDNPELLKKEEK